MIGRSRTALATLFVVSTLSLTTGRDVQAFTGNILGYVDLTTIDSISGWAIDYDNQNCGIDIHIYIYDYSETGAVSNLRVFGTTANLYRFDVGNHAFNFNPRNQGLTPGVKYMQAYAIGTHGVGGSCAPDHQNPALNQTVLTTYFEVPKQISSSGITCDAFIRNPIAPANGDKWLPPTVMTNDFYRVTYDFNVTQLSANNYTAIFHAERYATTPGQCPGDSIAARYADKPDGHFGHRTGNEDKIVTTTSVPSTYMWNDPNETEAYCADNYSGGANPILFKTDSQSYPNNWSLLWVSVAQQAGLWRHFLHLGQFDNVNDIHGANWSVHAENGGPPWTTFAGAPVLKNYNPTPVRNLSDGSLLQSQFTPTAPYPNGLVLANVSRDASLANSYYFYNDAELYTGQNCPYEYTAPLEDPVTGGGPRYCLKMMRRKLLGPEWANWYESPVRVMWGWAMKIAFHPARNRWMVVHGCAKDPSGPASDTCLQFTQDANVESMKDTAHGGHIEPLASTGTTLDSSKLGYSAVTNSQWGFLKNGYGQVASDDFRLYFRPGCDGCNFGETVIKSIRVKCQ